MMKFYPLNAPVPAEKRTARLVLHPLRAFHVELDYEAVMVSAEYLRLWSQSSWPEDHFTLAEDLEDLQRHEQEHNLRKAFTYTVLNLTETKCLGCVYVQPLWPWAEQLCAGSNFGAAVGFWTRTSGSNSDLDHHLLTTLRAWFKEAWEFDCVAYTCNPQDARQFALSEESEARSFFKSLEGIEWVAFR